MAKEAHSKDRKVPLAGDDWKPQGRASHPKSFGLVVSYTYTYSYKHRGQLKEFTRLLAFTNWYATERDRENAERSFEKNRNGWPRGIPTCKRIERTGS